MNEKISKLKEKTKGVLQLQGAKHILWDELIKAVASFRQQLVMIEEQEQALEAAVVKCKVVDEHLMKKSQEVAKNSINFLKTASGTNLITLGVKNRTTILVTARNRLAKYKCQQSVRSKVADIKTEVQKFKQAFLPLFQMVCQTSGILKISLFLRHCIRSSWFRLDWIMLNSRTW